MWFTDRSIILTTNKDGEKTRLFWTGPINQLYLKGMKFWREFSFTFSKKVHSLTNSLLSLTGQNNNLCFDNGGITNSDKHKS
jgi:hypothetical protein